MADEITDAEIAELRRRMDPHGENLLQSEADRVVSLVPGLLARLERAERERDEARKGEAAAEPASAADVRELRKCAGRLDAANMRGAAALVRGAVARVATLEAALRDICDHGLECWLGSDRNRSCVAIAEAALRGVEGKPAEAIAKEAADAAE